MSTPSPAPTACTAKSTETLPTTPGTPSPYFFNQQYQLGQEGVGAFPQSLVNPYLNRWTLGGTMGGPIKKDKVFFFGSYQHFSSSDQSTGISQMTVPPGLTNDRSTAGLDAAALSWHRGHPSQGHRSHRHGPDERHAARRQLSDSLRADANNPYQYGVPNVTLVGNSVMTSDQANGNVDWQISSKDRISTKYYYQHDPVTLPYDFSQTGGFPVTQHNGSQVEAIDNTIDINPHFNWEQRLGFFRQSGYC